MKVKKELALLLSGAMLTQLCACGGTPATESTQPTGTEEPSVTEFIPGTYEGTATSIGGTITLNVTFDKEKVTNVESVKMSDTRYVFEQAFSDIVPAILEGQTLNVDTVSGATYSSYAILTAVKNAAEQAGAAEVLKSAPAYTKAVKTDFETESDVLVIGAGLSGLTAALSAQEAGAKVTILEKLDVVGGSSMLSEGSFVGTTEESSVEKAIKNLEVTAEYLPTEHTLDMEKITATMNTLPEAHTWLKDTFSNNGFVPYGDNGMLINPDDGMMLVTYIKDFYRGDGNGGTVNTVDDRWNLDCTLVMSSADNGYHGADYVLKVLVNQFLENGGTIYTATPATELLTDTNGGVIGAKAEHNGEELTFTADSVILACGGAGRNTELLIERDQEDETYACIGDTGDAITMGVAIGAAVYEDQRILTNSGRIYPINLYDGVAYSQTPFSSIYVDDDGNRQVAEDVWMTLIHGVFRTEGRDHYWSIANADVLNDCVVEYGAADIYGMNMLELVESRLDTYSKYYVKADTIEELAEKLNMPDLPATLEKYNESARNGVDEFGKTEEYLKEMSEGPYYAVYATQYGPGTCGGVVTDAECHVLSEDGAVIPNLYAVGEASNGGFFTEAYMCTHMLGICLTTGRIAGQNAVK